MKFIALFPVLLLTFSIYATDTTKLKSTGIEFFVLPTVMYNSIDFGIVRNNGKRIEQALNLKIALNLLLPSAGFNMTYSFNYFSKSKKIYIPLWFDFKHRRSVVGYEEGYFPHRLRFFIGSGVGRLFQLSDFWSIRTELGLGISFNFTNAEGDILPYKTNFLDYKIDTRYPEYHPFVFPAARLRVTFIQYLKKQ